MHLDYNFYIIFAVNFPQDTICENCFDVLVLVNEMFEGELISGYIQMLETSTF